MVISLSVIDHLLQSQDCSFFIRSVRLSSAEVMAGASEKVEILPGRYYWMCSRTCPSDTSDAHYFSTDDLLIYDPYYGDFGPLNISLVCRYCRMMQAKMSDPKLEGKSIYHVCKPQSDTRANTVLLCCCFLLLYYDRTAEQAFSHFEGLKPALVPFRDASLGPPSFNLTVLHCLMGLSRAVQFGWYNKDTFDPDEYEHYERVENGDFNWIVPGKFLAFSGPTQTPIAYVDGVKTNTPETYFEYFKNNNVTGIVRFNNKVYDRKKFVDAGLNHYDMYFADGGNPTEAILKRFLEVSESEKGALAIHCKAGLGRTGTLISLYLMKHYGLTCPEVIAWLRLCRPGSVIGPQQNFLQEMEKRMWREGELHRRKPQGGQSAGEDLNTQMRSCAVSSSPSSPSNSANSAKAPTSPTRTSKASPGFSLGGLRSSPSRTTPTSPSSKSKGPSFLKR
ncbi:hypothetical protein AB1Y20_018667 [Prymnesium parvum]|uniref:protein-tyrosine-phosphatase n=1 Tax=Prymnesium parvum TaxID=97485 RepID=A0AB34JS53_PRYPA